jgi:NADPH:quinone reductase-like Zn-dependent oxidoreductase
VVEAVGEDVSRFRVGERVIPVYIQGWRDGALTPEQRNGGSLGGPLTGVLQDYVVVPAEEAVAAPDYLDDDQASTLPIAALTAWSCLQQADCRPARPCWCKAPAAWHCLRRSSRGPPGRA